MDQHHEADFEAFVRHRGPALLRTACLLTGDRGQAEDLLQDVLARVYLQWPRVRDGHEPVAYVRRALTNASTSRWRRLRARVAESPLVPGLDPGQDDATAAVDQRDELVRAMAALAPRQRAVLVLRFWEDMSEADTAAALGCSVGTVKSQTSRGLARLRDHLGPDRGGRPPAVPGPAARVGGPVARDSGSAARDPGHVPLDLSVTLCASTAWSTR